MAFTKVYEKSRHDLDGAVVYLAEKDGRDVLVCEGKPYFGGEAGENVFDIDHRIMNRLRELFPFTAPVPVLNRDRTVGVGDRLVSRATWFTKCATTWFTHLLLGRPLRDRLF